MGQRNEVHGRRIPVLVGSEIFFYELSKATIKGGAQSSGQKEVLGINEGLRTNSPTQRHTDSYRDH